MPAITISPGNVAWANSGALATNEDWQVRSGTVIVRTGTAPAADSEDGILLRAGSIAQFNTGETVHYRGSSGYEACRIWREPRP